MYMNVTENKQHFLVDCFKYITHRTTLHNRLQEANIVDTNFTITLTILKKIHVKPIMTLVKYMEISLKHHV